jgi:hypothetical protein
LREKGAALMQQAFAIAYVNIVFLYSTLFGWAMALCITILPGVIVGWRLQSADASIWTYALSAEALLLGLVALILIIETFYVGMRRFDNMITQPEGALLLVLIAHYFGLVPVCISIWLGSRICRKVRRRVRVNS